MILSPPDSSPGTHISFQEKVSEFTQSLPASFLLHVHKTIHALYVCIGRIQFNVLHCCKIIMCVLGEGEGEGGDCHL
jgi:hypothetical protein